MAENKRKKVYILQNGFKYGGTDTFVLNLVKGMDKNLFDITVILSGEDNDFPRIEELEKLKIKIVYTCGLNDTKGKLKHLNELYKILKTEKCDAFQTNIDLFNGANMFIAWMAGVPLRICHSHNSQQGRELREGQGFGVKVYQGLMRWFCWSFSNRRCGCSEAAMDFLFKERWKNDPNSKIIHNGIELEEYGEELDIDNKKEELGLTNKYNIVTVGRISFQKNPMFMVEIFDELGRLRDDCDCIWVGSGEMEEQVKAKIKEEGISNRVHLLGARSDISEILRSCDLFVLPSRFEGLGIVLIEAQAANLPCVCSDAVPLEADCGGCMFLSLEDNAKFWAEKISEILDNKKLSINKMKLNEYSMEHMVKEMEEVFTG